MPKMPLNVSVGRHCVERSYAVSHPMPNLRAYLSSPSNLATSVCDRCGFDVGKSLRCLLDCWGCLCIKFLMIRIKGFKFNALHAKNALSMPFLPPLCRVQALHFASNTKSDYIFGQPIEFSNFCLWPLWIPCRERSKMWPWLLWD